MAKDYCDYCARRFFERDLFSVPGDEWACKKCLIYLEENGVLNDTTENDEEIPSWISPNAKEHLCE